jgi:large subunit ribosomal protein L24e
VGFVAKCSFCGSEIKLGSGKMFVKKEGTVFFYCDSKCEKNHTELFRNPVNTKWTEAHHKLKVTTLSAKGKGKEKAKQ